MENARRITFVTRILYALSVTQLNLVLMILLIFRWYLESQKTLVAFSISKNIFREVYNKEKISNMIMDKKDKNICMIRIIQQ